MNPLVAVTSLALLALVPTSASSEPAKPVVALYPPEVLQADQSEVAAIRADVASELIRQGYELAPSEEVARFVDAHAAGGCLALEEKERVGCLAQLAQQTKTQRALLLVISPRARGQLRISAQVVGAAGAELKNISRNWPQPAKGQLQDALQRALRDLVPELDLRSTEAVVTPLTPEPPKETPPEQPPVIVTPSPAPDPTPRPTEPGWQKTAGWIAAGTGAVLVGAGGYALFDASQKRARFASFYENGKRPGVGDEEILAQLRQGAERNQVLGIVGLAAGAAAAAGGAYLLFGQSDLPSGQSASVALLVGPTHVGLVMELP